jgi:bifunctional non-homologous end joining protein LigD
MQGLTNTVDVAALKWARRSKMPVHAFPQIATRAASAPLGPAWLHETRLQGFRVLARIARDRVHWLSDQLGARPLPVLEEALAALGVDAILDGRLVTMRADGTTSLGDLERAVHRGRTADLVFGVFDVVHLNGYDLSDVELASRKQVLQALLSADGMTDASRVRYIHHFEGNGAELFADVCALGLPGLVSKLKTARYRSGPSSDWLDVPGVQTALHDRVARDAGLVARDPPRHVARGTPRALRPPHTQRPH